MIAVIVVSICPAPTPASAASTTAHVLKVGAELRPGAAVRSTRGEAELRVSRHGQLLEHLHGVTRVVAGTRVATSKARSTRLVLRRSGRLALLRGRHTELWSRRVSSHALTHVRLAESGALVAWSGARRLGSLELVRALPGTAAAPAPVAAPAPEPSAPDASTVVPAPVPVSGGDPLASGAVPVAPSSTPVQAVQATGAVVDVGNTLQADARLQVGQVLRSASGLHSAVVQDDGNFVVYGTGGAAWSIGASPGPGTSVVMQGDGNLVAYAGSGSVLWSSSTAPARGARAVMQDDGNLVVYSDGGLPLWSSFGGRTGYTQDGLPRLSALTTGQALTSSSGVYTAVMQSDGNLVVIGPTGPTWSSGALGGGEWRLVLQDDGNLVVYSAADRAGWAAGTTGRRGDRLVMQDDGNLVLYAGSTAVWASRDGLIATSGGGAGRLNRAIAAIAGSAALHSTGGQCLTWVADVIRRAGGPSLAFGMDASTYQQQWSRVADPVTSDAAAPGDIVQWYAPSGSVRGEMEHTAIITGTASGGTVRDSNWTNDGTINDGALSARDGWMSKHYGATMRIWRLRNQG